MKRFIPLVLLAIAVALPAMAQQSGDNGSVQADAEFEPLYITNQMGDKYIKMYLAPTFPVGFYNQYQEPSLYVGGLLGLGFHIFLNEHLAVGGDAGFGFNATVGSNVFNYIPIIATATWQFQYKRWEFPLTAGLGFAWELYNGYTFWPGLILEAQAGAMFRINTGWAVGGEATYMFMPQFARDPKKTVLGNFLNVTLCARYYF